MLTLLSVALLLNGATGDKEESRSLLLEHLVPKDDLSTSESQQVAVVVNHDLETAAGQLGFKMLLRIATFAHL